MWLILAFLSAFLLGFYDVFKKQSLKDNAVIPVLCFSTVLSALFFLILIVISGRTSLLDGTLAHVPAIDAVTHRCIILKAFIVSASWIFGYYGMKHLPITIVGPINATRPVLVLLGALLIFGERLNTLQWCGVLFTVVAFFLLGRSGKKEGIDFGHNRWIACVILAALFGVVSALYDNYLMARYDSMAVQAWCNVYIAIIMIAALFVFWYPKRASSPFRWTWFIVLISVFLTVADFAYFRSLSAEGSMLSIVSMVRRSNVLVSFLCGALFLHEKNARSKALGLCMVLIGMVFLYFGSR